MMNRRNRLTALLLALLLTLAQFPAGPTVAFADSVYGITILDNVNVRYGPSTKDRFYFKLSIGTVCEVRDETDNTEGHWYRVLAYNPDEPYNDPKDGYILGTCFRLLTEEEIAARAGGATVVTGTDNQAEGNTTVTGTTGTILSSGTNMRQGPSTHSNVLMKLDRNTVVAITSIPTVVDSDHWYGVSYNNMNGYVMSTWIRINGGSAASATISPVNTATPEPTNSSSTDTELNYVQLTGSSCHLRETPGGKYDSANDWVGKGTVLPRAGDSVVQNGVTWHCVSRNGKTYYAHSSFCQLIHYDGNSTTPVPSNPSEYTIVGYVQTIKGGCNLRKTASSNAQVIKTIGKYVTLPYLLQPVQNGNYTWYYVLSGSDRGYLRSDVVKVVTAPDVTATPTPTPTPTPEPGTTEAPTTAPTDAPTDAPTTAPEDEPTGYIKIVNSTYVNLRKSATTRSTSLGKVTKGTVMPYYGTPEEVSGVFWYHVKHATLGYGYIHGSYVVIVNADGSATPAPTGAVITVSSDAMPEASYTTLKLGSTGTKVTNLVTALKEQGYFTGTIISRYTSAVENAVRRFQATKGLTVDGVAGPSTQHALFGTVPVGTNTNLTMTIYPAEKIDWWTGGINEMWAKGANYKVYDVYTGTIWWAHRWSGGNHVDAEPLTAADTARICKMYGVTDASQITSSTHWQRRPCLVTIGERTFACSLYGVPHNDDGDTISTNNFQGQLCIHFTNSRTHGSNVVDSGHTAAIEYAYEHAPNGQK